MKKIILLAVAALFVCATASFASITGTFASAASLPAATDVNFVVSNVTNGPPITFTQVGSGHATSLAWGTGDMQFDSSFRIWTGKYYYAIDLSPTDGVNPAPGNYSSITFGYSGESNPSGQAAGAGLGQKAIFAPVRVNGVVETGIGGPTALKNAGSHATIVQADLAGGYLRVYVALYTGSPAVADAVPFSNGDIAGSYSGTFTITATLI